MLIIYDNKNIYYNGYNSLDGEVHSLDVAIPDGYYLDRIDTSVTPHQPIFKPIPKSEIELVRERIEELEKQNAALIEGINTVVKQEV